MKANIEKVLTEINDSSNSLMELAKDNFVKICMGVEAKEYDKSKISTNKTMDFYKKSSILICFITLFNSCVIIQTSMSPTEVYNTLPTLTKSKFLKEDEIKNLSCSCLTKNRSYTAPIGLTVKEDLKNGARGIDEWVSLDKANAYVLKNYKWMTVGYNSQNGATVTQLNIEFDTYICN